MSIMVEKYYGRKLVEFQAHQKQKLELINSLSISIAEVVEKYNVFFMHGLRYNNVDATFLEDNNFLKLN